MFQFAIRRGASLIAGWTATWFAHGLGDRSLSINAIVPMFNATARVITIKGDKVKAS